MPDRRTEAQQREELAGAIDRLFGTLVVLETADAAYLGCLRLRPDGRIAVHTGIVGQPPVVALDDIEAVTPAREHPAVVGL